jgi:peptide/nickel transport system permease protein
MQRYLVRRLLLFFPTLLLASLAVFVIMRALPGDVTAAILGGEGEALRPELVATLREELGLDDPLAVQYGRWLWSMVNGEFGGHSLATREPIQVIVARALPVTLQLTLYAALLAIIIAIPLGVAAARYEGRWIDTLARLLSVAGGAVPGFWIALVALLLLVLYFRWSPPLVYAHLWQNPLDHLQMMALPALVLAWELSAHLTRLTRAGMLEALQRDYVRTARGKGLGQGVVLLRHALRNALVPVITVAGLYLGGLLSGAVVLETIFGLPGLGRGIVQAVIARDYPVVQSLSLLLVALVLVINLLIDVLYALADPRISYAD